MRARRDPRYVLTTSLPWPGPSACSEPYPKATTINVAHAANDAPCGHCARKCSMRALKSAWTCSQLPTADRTALGMLRDHHDGGAEMSSGADAAEPVALAG